MVSLRGHPLDQNAGPEFDLVEQEMKEVEVFRDVQFIADPEVDGHATDTTKVEDDLGFRPPFTDILPKYCRSIPPC